MPTFRSWRWSALAIAFGLATPAARAEMITPDSIPNPPSAVASAAGTPVYSNNLVTTQYDGLGLRFGRAAITQLNNIPVWAPITGAPQGTISYTFWGVGGSFVRPGSLTPTTVSSLTLHTFGLTGTPDLVVDSSYGSQLNIIPVLQSGPGGSQVWTFTGPGIGPFGISPSASQTGPWGISEISFTPTPLPEPSSLVLAGLGALGLTTRFGWRRSRMAA
ncbi:MAG TPA: PEP-CTERM sorting domain-containing protein [Gemmataceae bacterium]|nr:PEP-CTERM sorting domain-containing protein [Gemmataceae bacterium]